MSSFTQVVKIGDYILKTPALKAAIVPVAQQFVKFSGYRQLGLKFEDIIAEENDVMQTAIRRLPAEESYARNFRIMRAHQAEIVHHLLPKNQHTTPEQDTPYLLPYILEAEAEIAEKHALDNLEVAK